MENPRKTGILLLAAVGLIGTAMAAHQLAHTSGRAPAPGPGPAKPPETLKAVASATCTSKPTATAVTDGDPRARDAAQKGLDFLAREAQAWQASHQCYGCHVHAVTMEAMAVGRHHQYKIADADMNTLLSGMLDLTGGARRTNGFTYQDDQLPAPAKAFGGAALARYDQWVGSGVANDLQRVAGELLTFQAEDGSIPPSWTNLPVGAGPVQSTYQAAQTWRQAYARTADDRWLLPLQKAERYLQRAAQTSTDAQEMNYALMGLAAAGVGSGDEVVQTLVKKILARRGQDGGWGLHDGGSDAFATGQTLYALRVVGLSDRDPVIAGGTKWLIDHQAEDGGWSHSGFGKAEAMWGVLGLVSVDVLTVAAKGLQDGDHLADRATLGLEARDNDPTGGGVVKVELKIDDVLVRSECGASLEHTWDTSGAEPGKHIIDLVAQNARGQSSRRRFEVYTGNVFMTQIGARSTEAGAEVSLRDIAEGGAKHQVEMEILSSDGKAKLATVTAHGERGPVSLRWDGHDAGGKDVAAGRYKARLIYRDAAGKAVQTEEIPFVKDSEAAQRAEYGELQGNLAMRPDKAGDAPAPAANAKIELVDDFGNVVQSTRSTATGQYRFHSVDAGKYKVRVTKEGFKPVEKPVDAKKNDENTNDLELQ